MVLEVIKDNLVTNDGRLCIFTALKKATYLNIFSTNDLGLSRSLFILSLTMSFLTLSRSRLLRSFELEFESDLEINGANFCFA